MVDFTKPDPNYWFKPEFAKPKEIPNNAKIKYFLINGKLKRFKVWKEQGYIFRATDNIIWRTIKSNTLDNISDAIMNIILPQVKDLFERDDIFYSKIKR